MSERTCTAEVIYVDSEGQRFSILMTEDRFFVSAHWMVFRRADITSVAAGECFVVELGPDPRDEQTAMIRKVVSRVARTAREDGESSMAFSLGDTLEDAARLLQALEDSRAPVVFSRLAIEEPFEHGGIEVGSTVVFADCVFSGDFRMLDAQINGDVWFVNCSFSQHFSLRGSKVTGNVVLFSCDFGGAGGISFRGVRGRSILLDYGVHGSSDMLWLNELVLSGCVVINGSFGARIQFRARQNSEEDPLNRDAEIQRILIGRDADLSEQIDENRYEGGIEFSGYRVPKSIEVHNCQVDELVVEDVRCGSLVIDHCRLTRDVVAKNVEVSDPKQGIRIRNSNIERHLQISGRSLGCRLDLDGTWVGQNWFLELDEPENGVPSVSLKRFIASSASFEPVHLVYGARARYHFLRPPDFAMLEGAKGWLPRDRERRLRMAEAYTSCKNWLASSGHLREEDHAFFYMRDAKEASAWRRIVFGVLFGWGIYLRNIVISALLVVVMFAIGFVSLGLSLGDAVMLSAQAFVASIFGDWPPFSPTGLVSMVATAESFVGILYITVIVGAYIRKLLR